MYNKTLKSVLLYLPTQKQKRKLQKSIWWMPAGTQTCSVFKVYSHERRSKLYNYLINTTLLTFLSYNHVYLA